MGKKTVGFTTVHQAMLILPSSSPLNPCSVGPSTIRLTAACPESVSSEVGGVATAAESAGIAHQRCAQLGQGQGTGSGCAHGR